MTIALPTSPRTAKAKPKLIGNSVETDPIIGGVVQRKVRLGTRWALDATLPVMDYAAAMAWTADLASSETEEVLLLWPQPAEQVGVIGAPVVNGGGQAGSSLAVRGATAGYTYKKGLFFSLVQGGRRYLHQITAAATANGAGVAVVQIKPMLRVVPGDGAVLEFLEPKIQGWAQVSPSWDLDEAMQVGLSISIAEAR